MTRLSELQARFQAYLLGPEAGPDRGIEPLTVGSERLPARQRLAVYADAYRLRLLEVLGDDFPGLKGLVGDQAFEEVGAAYIAAYPSTHPSVRWFGSHLPEFLVHFDGHFDGSHDRDAAVEMATFEWTQGEVMDAADDPVMDVATLGGLEPGSWPRMRFGFQGALRRLDLAWNVPAVWKAIREHTHPRALEGAERPVPWLLWRRGIEVHWRSLDEDERFALDAARDGRSFGEICDGMAARGGDEVPLRAAGFLKLWVLDGLVARVST